MSDKEVNNLEPAPEEGQAEKEADEIKDESKLSDDDELNKLEAEIKKRNEPKDEPINETEEEKTELPTEPPTETEEEIPEEIKEKSPEEIKKMYVNRRKLWDRQAQELDRLRKLQDEVREEKAKFKDYQINSTIEHTLRQVEEMKPEERDKFYEEFSDSPVKALKPLISKIMLPFQTIQARYENQMEIDRLIKDTKDKPVPYNEEEINKVIASFTDKYGRNRLFDKYGKGAFREAYNIYRDANYDEVMKKKEEELIRKAEEKANEAISKKKSAFTEPPGKSSASKAGKQKIDYNAMETDKAIEELEKILPRSNR